MYKLVIPLKQDLALDDAETLIDLKQKYPRSYFKTGMYKDAVSLFVLGDLTTREYGTQKKLKDGSTFFAPKEELDVSAYEKSVDLRQFKIEVKLSSGKSIWIKPASLEPQQYSLFDDTEQESYSQATAYGRMAYSIFDDIRHDKEISMADARVREFIKLIVVASYDLPLVVFDSLNIISVNDLLNIVTAGLGINEELLEVKKNT